MFPDSGSACVATRTPLVAAHAYESLKKLATDFEKKNYNFTHKLVTVSIGLAIWESGWTSEQLFNMQMSLCIPKKQEEKTQSRFSNNLTIRCLRILCQGKHPFLGIEFYKVLVISPAFPALRNDSSVFTPLEKGTAYLPAGVLKNANALW